MIQAYQQDDRCHVCGMAFRLHPHTVCEIAVRELARDQEPLTTRMAFCQRCSKLSSDLLLQFMRVILREATADLRRRLDAAGIDRGVPPL
jgi:hypothetical protein